MSKPAYCENDCDRAAESRPDYGLNVWLCKQCASLAVRAFLNGEAHREDVLKRAGRLKSEQ